MQKSTYTPEQTIELRSLYAELGNDGLPQIAEKLGKTVKSVQSKLIHLGDYVNKPKTRVRKTEGPSKKELIAELVQKTGYDFVGIEGATKEVLKEIIIALDEAYEKGQRDAPDTPLS